MLHRIVAMASEQHMNVKPYLLNLLRVGPDGQNGCPGLQDVKCMQLPISQLPKLGAAKIATMLPLMHPANAASQLTVTRCLSLRRVAADTQRIRRNAGGPSVAPARNQVSDCHGLIFVTHANFCGKPRRSKGGIPGFGLCLFDQPAERP
jgi:hypothetical protein